jgi:hypothetical protein
MLAFLLLTASPAARLPAQVSLHAGLGARYSSALVHDSIVVPIDLQPGIGPAFALAVSERSRGAWTPDATLDVTWAALQRHERGTTSQVTSLTTLAFTVGVSHAIKPGFTGRVGAGALKYLPSQKTGLFRDGSGITALGAVSLDWIPAATATRAIGLTLRYDVHGFTTPALHAEGFTARQIVHRLSLGVSARVLGGDNGKAP